MAIKGLKAGGVTVQDSDVLTLNSGVRSGANFSGFVPITKIDGSNAVMGVNGGVLGYIETFGTTTAIDTEFGFADDAAGLNFVVIIPKEIYAINETKVFSPIALFVPAGKFLVVNQAGVSTNHKTFLQWIDL